MRNTKIQFQQILFHLTNKYISCCIAEKKSRPVVPWGSVLWYLCRTSSWVPPSSRWTFPSSSPCSSATSCSWRWASSPMLATRSLCASAQGGWEFSSHYFCRHNFHFCDTVLFEPLSCLTAHRPLPCPCRPFFFDWDRQVCTSPLVLLF